MSSNKQVVALAGLGTIGFHVLDAVKASSTWSPLVLTRKSSSASRSRPDVAVAPVDYEDVEELKQVFRDNKVAAVLSFVNATREPAYHVKIHTNLMEAAKASGAQRFVPSEWAADVNKYPNWPKLYHAKAGVREALKTSGLEYTLVCTGLFMDYLLPRGSKKYLQDVSIPVNPEDKTARIPGTGDEPQTLTSADDVGRATVWLLDQPLGAWKPFTYFCGEHTTWNRILRQAEGVVGQKFSVESVSNESIERRMEDADRAGDAMAYFYAEVDIGYGKGFLSMPDGDWEKDARERMTVAKTLKDAYGKK